MSIQLGNFSLQLPNQPISREFVKLPYRLNKNRASTTLNSPRSAIDPVPSSKKKGKISPNLFPYSGLSIGLIKLQKRTASTKVPAYPALNYSHYFSDMYLNSETISFPQGNPIATVPEFPEKLRFSLPAKLNFRRLKRRSWGENKNKVLETTNFSNTTSRTVGRSYNTTNKNKRELLPVTKFRAIKATHETLGLRIRGLFK